MAVLPDKKSLFVTNGSLYQICLISGFHIKCVCDNTENMILTNNGRYVITSNQDTNKNGLLYIRQTRN